jgi:lysophospholipase L1-like esterase
VGLREGGLFGLVLALVAPAMCKDIIVIGDSWGTVGRAEFEDMATEHRLTVENIAISGTTAEQWATSENLLKVFETLTANPDAKHIWLTVGGNDVMNGLKRGDPIADIIKKLRADTLEILEPIFKFKANISVVQFGYDIPNYDSSRDCLQRGAQFAGAACNTAWASVPTAGWTDYMNCSNQAIAKLQYDYVDWLGREAQEKRWPYVAVDLLGTFQHFGGVPRAEIGKPNVGYYSPTQFWQPDCTHCSPQGYTLIFHVLWEKYFARFYPDQSRR